MSVPMHLGEATTVWLGLRSVRRRGKTARPRACSRWRRRLIWSARPWTIVSITMWPVRQWRITATADRAAPEPFYPLSRVAARPVAPLQPHRRHFADRAAAHRAGL